MFRGRQTLTRTCSRSLLLLLRDSHLSASPEDTGSVWQSLRCVKGRRYAEIPGSAELCSTGTASCSTHLSEFCLNCNRLKDVSFPNLLFKATSCSPHQPVQISVSKVTTQVCNLQKCTLNFKAGSPYFNVLAKGSCLQPWTRPWDFCQASTSKTVCNFHPNHLYHRQHSARPFSSSTHATRTLNEFPHSPPSSFSPQQRTNHQAAPHLLDAWRNCLSQENENRCRQTLAPNLKFYEVKRVAKGSNHNQGKLASILVSLCSVRGEPVFLFTLRSSTLKGRHKGDVRWVAA